MVYHKLVDMIKLRTFLLYTIGLLLLSPLAWGQSNPTNYGIGFLSGQSKTTDANGKQIIYTFSGGSILAPGTHVKAFGSPNGLDTTEVLTGFVPYLTYFPQVFSGNLFASKGYYAEYVQLNWDIEALQDNITRFRVFRKILGEVGDSTLIAVVDKDSYIFRDAYVDKGVLYKYTVYAEGIADGLRLPSRNILEGVGFALPTGVAAGHVTYEGGNAVQGVRVTASTDGDLEGKSVYLKNEGYLSIPDVSDSELELREGFTFQAWFRATGSGKGTLFSKGNDYEISYDPTGQGQLSFTVGDATARLPFKASIDTFFHVTASYQPTGELKLYVNVSDEQGDSVKIAAGTQPAINKDNILIGRNQAGNYLEGYVDEIRLWKRELSATEIKTNYSIYIAGEEEGLIGYWRLLAGTSQFFFDRAQRSNIFYEHHGFLKSGATWSTVVPNPSQLAFVGITDEQGNYTIKGFPYETGGSLYQFTAIYGVHQFDPAQQIRFVGDGQSIQNEVDFTDISSFKVSGTVTYRHSFFPVEGCFVRIDGQPAISTDGTLVTTNSDGYFEVDVPIGLHSVRVDKSQHEFERNGYYVPIGQEDKEIPLFDYQAPVSGLEFTDKTLVKFVGRVAGGAKEKEKPLGFGLSVNNIGNATITLQAEKERDLTKSDSTATYNEEDISSSARFLTKTVAIYPDRETGEFVAYLPPEKYAVLSATAGDYTFDNSYLTTINLENFVEQPEIYSDTVFALYAGEPVAGYPPVFDPNNYDLVDSVIRLDTIFYIGIDSFYYDVRKDYILRVRPEVEVTNNSGETLLGEAVYEFVSAAGESEDIPLIENDEYTFGYPIFLQRQQYQLTIEVFEEYTNVDKDGLKTRVPVSDGSVEVINNFAINTDKVTVELNDSGKARYMFSGGLPQTSVNNNNPEESFTQGMGITAVTGNGGTIRTEWNNGQPLKGIVIGGISIGNDFVTLGPSRMITILRDPPGSNSYTYFEKGSEIENTYALAGSASFGTAVSESAKLGARFTTFVGMGAGTITELNTEVDTEQSYSLEGAYQYGNEEVTTTTTTQTWSTFDADPFIGPAGDVFIGYSTNLIYGAAISLEPIKVDDPSCEEGNCGGLTYNGYTLGTQKSLRLDTEFGTSFSYSQLFIEEQLIPNLITVRNNFLQYAEDPNSIPVTGDDPVYISLIPTTDERFGASNNDEEVWEDLATDETGVGPSYIIKYPENHEGVKSDTILHFNNQVSEWEFWLGENEKAKVNATLEENISLDGGATYEKSQTTSESETNTHEWDIVIAQELSGEWGFELNGNGYTQSITQSSSLGTSGSDGRTETNEITYGYVLSDPEGVPVNGGVFNDYHSIDVKKPKDGYGPVFILRGGTTSCPYEGEIRTSYYRPGQEILQYATVQVEKANLEIVNASISGVPDNRSAEIKIKLQNTSEAGAEFWGKLIIDDNTNPNGLAVMIDGSIINGQGFEILLPAGETLEKTLFVTKQSASVFDYEDIKLLLVSACDLDLDEANFSVFFQPGCSDISLKTPNDLWTVNTFTVPENILEVSFDKYDLQNERFKYAAFQYKATSSSQWTTNRFFYNPQQYTQAEYDALDEPKAWLDAGGTTTYAWDMGSLPDRPYDIRVITSCELSAVEFTSTPSDIHSGIKDVKRPKLFGSPQPADGVLSANDEISVRFDEPLEEGLVGLNNFSVTGILNNYEIAHDASVNFDGQTNYVSINEGLPLIGTSFTVEFWLKRSEFGREQVVFSKGNVAGDMLEIGFTDQDQLFIDWGSQERMVSNQRFNTTVGDPSNPVFVPDNLWNHYAVAYDLATQQIQVYRSGEYVIENAAVTANYSGLGPINIGRGALSKDRHFNGQLHELRLWSQPRSLADVVADFNLPLSGLEIGLIGNWPMEEAFGNLAYDNARFRHAQVNADWAVLPLGRAYAFDGTDDYLQLNTGSTIVIADDMDFTVEFWFKAPAQSNAVIFSSGKGDGSDVLNTGSWSIGFNESSKLYVASNANYLTLEGENQNYLDNQWHHFAFTLSRRGNATVFIDGLAQKSISSEGFGSLAGQYMWLGARGFKADESSFTFDHHFNGLIDEVRVWRLQRKQQQISLYRNEQVQFDQMGLVGYYPFERFVENQGQQEMVPTLFDLWSPPANLSNGGQATAFGNSDFSNETAKIKQAKPVTKVDFAYAVNDDQIIITPNPDMREVIEKTILEITVDRIEDKNGNRIASPVTWAAFVDQNQLKWGQAQISLEKELYQELSFEVEVTNYSGDHQEFSITNLPAWLEASVSMGSLAPQTTTKILFTVNPGVNTGTYQEDIFLTGDFGFDEKLSLDLRVFRPLPNGWSINPSNFAFSMNVIAQLEIGGRISLDPNDILAVFVGDECRGLVNLQYVSAYDNYQAFLTVYSSTGAQDDLSFKVWDDSDGFVYTNITPDGLRFETNKDHGKPSEPLLFKASNKVENYIDLPAGWKWVSFALSTNELADINAILKNVEAAEGDQIKNAQYFNLYAAADQQWLGSLTSNGGLQNEQMYKMYVSNPSEIKYTGEITDPTSKPISVNPGWNWIGFVSQQNLEVNEALQTLAASDGDIIKSQYKVAVYDANFGWIGNLGSLFPGEGYLLKSQNAGTITYPKNSSLGGGRILGKTEEDLDFLTLGDIQVNPHAFQQQMTVIATIADYQIKNPERSLKVVANSESVHTGISEVYYNPATGKYGLMITVYGQQSGESVNFSLFDEEGRKMGNFEEELSFQPQAVAGSLKQPLQLHLKGHEGLLIGVGEQMVFPNPFQKRFQVAFNLAMQEEVTLMLFDALGRQIAVWPTSNLKAGVHQIEWAPEGLTSGTYIVQIKVGEQLSRYKLIKQ